MNNRNFFGTTFRPRTEKLSFRQPEGPHLASLPPQRVWKLGFDDVRVRDLPLHFIGVPNGI
jgi:hypothetical protein